MNKKNAKHILSIPFIWAPLFSGLIMHLFVFVYQAVGFRLYGIERIRIRDYVFFDRSKLSYLSTLNKINCAYCSYMNGLCYYMSEIGRRTEYYWCGIKHKNQPDNPAFAYQDKFAKYGDKEDYVCLLEKNGHLG